MDAGMLKAKWNKIASTNVVRGFKSIRISNDCFSDLYLGVDEDGRHSLILSLPNDHGVEFNSLVKEKISVELFPESNYLVMTLIDYEYNNLFDDLIISIFNAIKEIEEVGEYSKIFILTFYQWILFFMPGNNERLSKELIKGLWGELIVLKTLIEDESYLNIDKVLAGWTGPYDKGHDFVYDDYNIEVKTKDVKKICVRISSEHQLEVEVGKGLNLSVVSVSDDLVNGCSLKEILLDIKMLVFEHLGDFSIVLKALLQKGITSENIKEYDNYRFELHTIHNYDCLINDFPRMTSTKLPASVSNLSYEINLTYLTDYMTSVREY